MGEWGEWGGVASWFGRDGCGGGVRLSAGTRIPEEAKAKKAKTANVAHRHIARTHALTRHHSFVIVVTGQIPSLRRRRLPVRPATGVRPLRTPVRPTPT